MKDIITLGKSDEGSIDVDINKLVDSRMLIQGNSGGGKSYLLRLLCERAAGHVPIIILDSEGEFASLREKVDAILIGPEGEVPTDLRSAAILPRKLIELQISAIIDLYELKPHDRRQYVKLFLDALIELPRDLWHPTLIVIDEAHKFAPEKGQGDAVSTQSVIDLMSLGRKRGYAGVLATQRFSKLHNDAIAETNNVFIGRTWMDADQKRAGEYLGLAASDRRMLRDLKPGEFYAFGPALSIGGIVKFKGDKVGTSHPKPGERHKIKPPKASDAIQQIVSQIEDLPEVAEQEKKDIESVKDAARKRETELNAQIRELEQQLKSAPVETTEKLVYPEAAIIALQDKVDGFYSEFSRAIDAATEAAQVIEEGVTKLREAVPQTRQPPSRTDAVPTRTPAIPKAPQPTFAALQSRPAIESDGPLNKAERQILQAFYWTKDETATPAKIGFYSDYSHSSGSFKNACGSLRAKGLLSGWSITDEGEAVASQYAEVKPSGADLREWLRPKIDKCANEILDVLINSHGQRLGPDDIAAQTVTQYSPTSGSFKNAMGRLRSLEVAEGYAADGVKAADVFFT